MRGRPTQVLVLVERIQSPSLRRFVRLDGGSHLDDHTSIGFARLSLLDIANRLLYDSRRDPRDKYQTYFPADAKPA